MLFHFPFSHIVFCLNPLISTFGLGGLMLYFNIKIASHKKIILKGQSTQITAELNIRLMTSISAVYQRINSTCQLMQRISEWLHASQDL